MTPIKYQTTNDIIGFSLTGLRKDSDFDTYYIYSDEIIKEEKNAYNIEDETQL